MRKVGGALAPKKEPPAAPPVRVLKDDEQPDLSALLKPVFGDGLLGKAASALLGAAVKGVAGQMRSAAAASEEAHSAAVALVERDSRVSAALGGPVRCGPPFAVSSSSSSINGVTRSSTALQFMVEGARGGAPVEVQAGDGRLVTRVRLPTGDILLDGRGGGGGGGGGQIIDVDASDYRVR